MASVEVGELRGFGMEFEGSHHFIIALRRMFSNRSVSEAPLKRQKIRDLVFEKMNHCKKEIES